MNVMSDLAVFKGKVKTAVQIWVESLVDGLMDNPIRRRNVKRVVGNWLDFHDERMNKWLDTVALMGLDKDGNINSDLIVEEAAALFKEMDYHTTVCGCGIDVSGGKAVFAFPDNMFSYLVFGNKSGFCITEQDILKIKDYLS